MQLDSNECSFMTYFDSENEALFIISALKTEGFNNVQLSPPKYSAAETMISNMGPYSPLIHQ